MGRPFQDAVGNDVAVLLVDPITVEVQQELIHLSTGDLEDTVPLGAGNIVNSGTRDGQRSRPEVVTILAETDGSTFQLVVDVNTSNPK